MNRVLDAIQYLVGAVAQQVVCCDTELLYRARL